MEVWGELSKQRGVGASKILILGRVGSFRIRYMCVGVLGTDLGSLLHVAIFLLFLQIPPTYKSYSVIVTGFTHMIIQNQGWSYRFWNPLSSIYVWVQSWYSFPPTDNFYSLDNCKGNRVLPRF